MLEQIYYHNTLKQWLIAVIIIIGTAILCKILSLINKKIRKKLERKIKKSKNNTILEKLETPFLVFLMLLSFYICFQELNFSVTIVPKIQKSFKILFGLDITWAFSRLCTAILYNATKQLEKKNPDFKRLLPLLKRFIIILIWGIGIIMVLNNIGITIGALLGTLGIGGLAVALAAQDTVKNIIGGITLISDHSFKIGDRIKFGNIDGNVEDIGLRSTKIRTLDKRIITIPNSQIIDASIENVSGEYGRRIVVELSLSYDTTSEKLKQAIEILNQIPQKFEHIDKLDFSATFQNFGNSSLIITLIYFIKKTSPDIMESISEINFYILENFNNNKIYFALPIQTIYIEKKDT